MFSETKARISLPTPLFWRKLQKRSLATSVALAGVTTKVAMIEDHLPKKLKLLPLVVGFASAFFGGIASICSLAVDDATQLPEPETTTTPELSAAAE